MLIPRRWCKDSGLDSRPLTSRRPSSKCSIAKQLLGPSGPGPVYSTIAPRGASSVASSPSSVQDSSRPRKEVTPSQNRRLNQWTCEKTPVLPHQPPPQSPILRLKMRSTWSLSLAKVSQRLRAPLGGAARPRRLRKWPRQLREQRSNNAWWPRSPWRWWPNNLWSINSQTAFLASHLKRAQLMKPHWPQQQVLLPTRTPQTERRKWG